MSNAKPPASENGRIEYTVVDGQSLGATPLEELLNSKAEEGWRLASHDGYRYIFERPRQDDRMNQPRER
jgi:hypothetical protein